jgi:zinc protease
MGEFTHSISGWTVNKDAKTLFELLYLDFTQPKFDSKVVKAGILKYKSQLENEDKEPKNVFAKDFTKIIFGNDPYFKPLEFSDFPNLITERHLNLLKSL